MKKLLWSFIIIFFASLILWAQEPTEDDAEEPAPIERILPPLAPVKSPIPEPTVIQPEAPKEKPEDKIGRELPGLAPVDPPEVILQPQRQIQQFPTLSPVAPPEQMGEAQRQIQQFPLLSPVSPPRDAVEPERATQQFPALSPVTAPAFQDQVQGTLRRFQELSPVTAPASHNPGNPGQLAYARQSFSNLPPVGTPSSVYRTLKLSDFSGGLNKRDFPTEIADNEVTELVNFVWEGKKLRPRDGFTTYYDMSEFAIGYRIYGLYRFYTQDGRKILLAGAATSLYADTVGEGTFVFAKTGLQENNKYYYFDTFKDKCIVAHEGDYPFWYDGKQTASIGLLDTGTVLDTINNTPSSCHHKTVIRDRSFEDDEIVGYIFSHEITTGLWQSEYIIGNINGDDNTDTIFTTGWAQTELPKPGEEYKIQAFFSLDSLDAGIIDSAIYCWPDGDTMWPGCAIRIRDIDKSWSGGQFHANYSVLKLTSGPDFGRISHIYWSGTNYVYIGTQFGIPDTANFVGQTYTIAKIGFWKPKLVRIYKNRIFFIGSSNQPNLIIFSEYNDLNNFSPDNYFTVKTQDGDHITALATFYDDQLGYKDQSKDCLVIFKQNSIYKLVWNSATDCALVQVVEGIGCVAPQTVVNVEGKYLLFLHTTGVYAFDGRTVTPIYLNIQPLLADSINQNKIEMASAGYCDRHYYLSYPAGTSIENNRGIVFNVDLGVWGETDNFVGGIFAQQNAISDTVKLLFSDRCAKSLIYQFGKVASDTGQPISLTLKSKAFNLGDLHKRKRFTYFDIDYYLDSDSVKTWFYTDFGDSLRYNTYVTESGGNRHARIPLNADCLGRNFSFKLTSDSRFELGSVAFKFRQIGE